MKKIWIISDTHLGHANMTKYCGRPENFNELILRSLAKMIKPGDTLIHLGDICFGNHGEWHEKLMKALPGVTKILVKGNHDNQSVAWYESHGWDKVCEIYSLMFKDAHILFSHEPIPKIQSLNIHGHFHNNLDRLKRKEWVVEGEEERNRVVLANMNDNHKLLAIEYTNYKPVLLDKFIKKMKDKTKITELNKESIAKRGGTFLKMNWNKGTVHFLNATGNKKVEIIEKLPKNNEKER